MFLKYFKLQQSIDELNDQCLVELPQIEDTLYGIIDSPMHHELSSDIILQFAKRINFLEKIKYSSDDSNTALLNSQ